MSTDSKPAPLKPFWKKENPSRKNSKNEKKNTNK